MRLRWISLPIVWLASILAAEWSLEAYQARPGSAGLAPGALPDAVRSDETVGRSRLLMFVHPFCPCSRASLTELANLLAAGPRDLTTEILLMAPEELNDEAIAARLREVAAAIPQARVRRDEGGIEARRFGVETSGHALLYDRSGRLVFSGGITRSRGHAGSSPGLRSLLAALDGAPAEDGRAPVFGCPLFAASAPEKTP